jgi:hypothetical protein
MPAIYDDTPRIQVWLYKTISRTTLDGQAGVSTRYAGKDERINLAPFLQVGSAVRTTKGVREPAGAFAISFADRPQGSWSAPSGTPFSAAQLETVYGLVEPQDMVEIRMWSGRGAYPKQNYPLVMRGFVSRVGRTVTMSDDGKPINSVVITGQDYGKIWQMYRVLHLAAYMGGKALLTNFALSEMFGLKAVNSLAAPEFVRTMITKVINPFLNEMLPDNTPLPKEIQTGDTIAVKHGTVNQSYQQMEGSIYDILRFHGDVGIWNELYLEDREDGVHCVYRPIPAMSISPGADDSNLIQDDAPEPIFVPISAGDIVTVDVARTDANVANFFWVNGARLDLIDDMTRKLMAIQKDDKKVSTAEYPNTALKFYGLRPMMAETQQADDEVKNQGSGEDKAGQDERSKKNESWIDKRRRVMMEMNKDNVVLECGTIHVKGGQLRPDGETMKAGDYARIRRGQTVSDNYVVQLDNDFQPFQSFTTTLTVERGEGFINRAAMEGSPYLAERVIMGGAE